MSTSESEAEILKEYPDAYFKPELWPRLPLPKVIGVIAIGGCLVFPVEMVLTLVQMAYERGLDFKEELATFFWKPKKPVD